MINNLPKNYEPKQFEDRIYQHWMDKGYFKAEVNPEKKTLLHSTATAKHYG